jgi:hypothetical protein
MRGEGIRVLELNGLTAEATSIYDPRHSVLDAWRTLAAQWRIAFRIGAAQVRLGARKASWREIIGMVAGYRRSVRKRAGV